MEPKQINIVSLQMIKTGALSYLKRRITSPEDATEIMKSFIGNSDCEHLILICMNSKTNQRIFKHYPLDLLINPSYILEKYLKLQYSAMPIVL